MDCADKLTLQHFLNGTDNYDEKHVDDPSRKDDDFKEYILGYSPRQLQIEEGKWIDPRMTVS